MAKQLTRHGIIRKMLQISASTLASKVLGFFRTVLMARYLGVGVASDAFFAAYQLPSSLRKIFAEGALNAAMVPTAVAVMQTEGREQVARFTTLLLIIMQSFLLVGCALIAYYADTVLWLSVPGWGGESGLAGYVIATRLLRVLIFFISFVSAGAIFSGVFQTVNCFSMPIVAQILTNGLLVLELLFCGWYDLSNMTLAFFVVGNSIVILLIHILVYYYFGFRFALPDRNTWRSVGRVLCKFIPCVIGMGAIEINLFIDRAIASYLPQGSITLLQNTFAFARIPLGVFAGAFAVILLPHFSRISVRAPKRLSFYLFESAKFIWWVTIPATLFTMFFSYKMYYTLLLSTKFTATHVLLASQALTIFIIGLFVLSFEKIVLNMFYALHETRLPTIYTLVSALFNTGLSILFIPFFGLNGILLAVVIASTFKLMLCMWSLRARFKFVLYGAAFGNFLMRATIQMVCGAMLFAALYFCMLFLIGYLPSALAYALTWKYFFWLWVSPLCALVALFFYKTRRLFGIRLHFID